jgi:hypothetical protein
MMYDTQIYWLLDFAHRLVFKKLENRTFRKLDLFPSSGEGEPVIEVSSF